MLFIPVWKETVEKSHLSEGEVGDGCSSLLPLLPLLLLLASSYFCWCHRTHRNQSCQCHQPNWQPLTHHFFFCMLSHCYFSSLSKQGSQCSKETSPHACDASSTWATRVRHFMGNAGLLIPTQQARLSSCLYFAGWMKTVSDCHSCTSCLLFPVSASSLIFANTCLHLDFWARSREDAEEINQQWDRGIF